MGQGDEAEVGGDTRNVGACWINKWNAMLQQKGRE